MMNFCTIVSGQNLYRAIALGLSLRRARCDFRLTVLTFEETTLKVDNVNFITLATLCGENDAAQKMLQTYGEDHDKLRWCLKPVFLSHLISNNSPSVYLYCDSDCCFFDQPLDIFRHLDSSSVVLTPHWRPLGPRIDQKNFRLNFLDGLYNAGCVGASDKAVDALHWWADACLHACEKSYEQGLYHDQRYLDLMPIYFDNVHVLKHRGYNLADWNLHLRLPTYTETTIVPDVDPVVMVHFTSNTILRIERGGDLILKPYLEVYKMLVNDARACSGESLAQ